MGKREVFNISEDGWALVLPGEYIVVSPREVKKGFEKIYAVGVGEEGSLLVVLKSSEGDIAGAMHIDKIADIKKSIKQIVGRLKAVDSNKGYFAEVIGGSIPTYRKKPFGETYAGVMEALKENNINVEKEVSSYFFPEPLKYFFGCALTTALSYPYFGLGVQMFGFPLIVAGIIKRNEPSPISRTFEVKVDLIKGEIKPRKGIQEWVNKLEGGKSISDERKKRAADRLMQSYLSSSTDTKKSPLNEVQTKCPKQRKKKSHVENKVSEKKEVIVIPGEKIVSTLNAHPPISSIKTLSARGGAILYLRHNSKNPEAAAILSLDFLSDVSSEINDAIKRMRVNTSKIHADLAVNFNVLGSDFILSLEDAIKGALKKKTFG